MDAGNHPDEQRANLARDQQWLVPHESRRDRREDGA